MKVQEELYQLRLPRDPNRSPGLHLSTILRDLALRSGVLDAKWDTPMEDRGSELAQIGLAFEDYLARYQHPEIEFHPGELKMDGISMSPDGIQCVDNLDLAEVLRVDMHSYVLSEFKLTKKSSRDFKESLRLQAKNTKLWLWQIMSYRHALNQCTDYVNNLAKLHVMFVNGNYSRKDEDPEANPTYKIFKLYFESEELANNWAMVKSHRDFMRSKGLVE